MPTFLAVLFSVTALSAWDAGNGKPAALPVGRVPVVGSAKSMAMVYDKPAGVWNEALPIGNGRLGGMVFGATPYRLGDGTELAPMDSHVRELQNPSSREEGFCNYLFCEGNANMEARQCMK